MPGSRGYWVCNITTFPFSPFLNVIEFDSNVTRLATEKSLSYTVGFLVGSYQLASARRV